MPFFFAFSDESGKHKKERTDKFILKNPYYCRSVVLLEADDWIKLKDKFYHLKRILENIFAAEEKNYHVSLDAKLS